VRESARRSPTANMGRGEGMFSKKKKKDEEAPSETSGLAASGAPASGGATSSSAAPPADVEHGQVCACVRWWRWSYGRATQITCVRR
jgi:hypothetical protein